MKLKMSFCNKGIIFSNLKRFWWISALHTLILFLVIPLQFLMQNDSYIKGDTTQIDLLGRQYSFADILICGFAVAICVLIFRYMQVSKSSTMMHGMPFSRTMLYISSVISGILLITIPFVINGVIILWIKHTMEIGAFFTTLDIGMWFVNSFVLSLVLFSLATFVGMFTGNSIAHFVFTYIIHFLPLVLYGLIGGFFDIQVFGFSFIEPPEILMNFPMMRATIGFDGLIWWYMGASVILLVLAIIAYKKRHLERASDIVIFKFFKHVFKYGVTFCVSLAGYIFIGSIYHFTPEFWVILIWAFIGYVIAEMLIQKSFKIWNSYKGFIAVVIVFLMLFAVVKYDITGFEKRVPNVDKVTMVELSRLSSFPNFNIELTDKQVIELALALHKQATLCKNDGNVKYIGIKEHGVYINLKYTLKNNKTINRHYEIEREKLDSALKTLYENEEFKISAFPVISQRVDDIKYVKYNNKNEIYDKNKIQSLKEALVKDILSLTYEEIIKDSYSNIFIYDSNNKLTDHYKINTSYTNTFNWLKDNGM